jgi:ABC-type transport system substrate-binding protein
MAGNGIKVIPPPWTPPDWGITLVYATAEGPADLDPIDAWDEYSFAVQDQVCEGLFGYNYSDPDMEIIPKLAKGFGKWEDSNYTVKLRDDVWFHDGTKFNAYAAKWNFERLHYFMNNGLVKAGELFEYYDVSSKSFQPIINHTEVIDELTLKFVCNTLYGPFEALLCFNTAYMLSPTSTSLMKIIDTPIGHLIGTGPFVYDHYEAGVEIRFHTWDYYYKPRAKIDTLIFSVIHDAQIRNNALLSGDIDLLLNPMNSMIKVFDSEPDVQIINAGSNVKIQYLGMNNYYINATFRRAISHVINTSYINEEFLEGSAVQIKSPVPKGISYANWSYNIPEFNITKSRIIMQSMGFGVEWDPNYPGSNESSWKASHFIHLNYSLGDFCYPNFKHQLFSLLVDDLALIGIELDDDHIDWAEFNEEYELWYCYTADFALTLSRWFPDFNDPSNYINSMFTNKSLEHNKVNYNGYEAAKDAGRNPFNLWDNVQLLMEEALIEVNQSLRQKYYNRIQQLLVEEDIPWAYGVVDLNYDVWNIYVKGFPSNPMDKAYFYPCYWADTALYAQ